MLKARTATEEQVKATGLEHRVYVPEGSSDSKPPLVLFVHGRAGTAESMWTFSKALQEIKPVVVSPQGFLEDPVGGFSWWLVDTLPSGEPRVERRTTAEDLELSFEKLEPFIEKACELYGADPKRIYAAGFSQGGAVIASLSLQKPELFKGVALLASFIPSVVFKTPGFIAQEVADRTALMPDYFFAHGTEDKIVRLDMAQGTRDSLEQMGAEVEFHTDAVGHKVGAAGVKKLKSWFERIVG